jgi:hypothetical protein
VGIYSVMDYLMCFFVGSMALRSVVIGLFKSTKVARRLSSDQRGCLISHEVLGVVNSLWLHGWVDQE